MELPWDGGTKSCSNGQGHMTKLATMPIYMVKTFKNFLLWNRKANDLETWYASLSTQALPSLFKRCPWVDLDLFYSKIKLSPFAFVLEKVTTMDFSEPVVVCDIKLSRCSQLNEYMKL